MPKVSSSKCRNSPSRSGSRGWSVGDPAPDRRWCSSHCYTQSWIWFFPPGTNGCRTGCRRSTHWCRSIRSAHHSYRRGRRHRCCRCCAGCSGCEMIGCCSSCPIGTRPIGRWSSGVVVCRCRWCADCSGCCRTSSSKSCFVWKRNASNCHGYHDCWLIVIPIGCDCAKGCDRCTRWPMWYCSFDVAVAVESIGSGRMGSRW